MKKLNLVLFLVLALGLTITYFVHEKFSTENKVKLEQQSQLLNFESVGDIKRFTSTQADILKEGDQYYTSEARYPVNKNKIEEVFLILANLKVKSLIDQNEIEKIGYQNFFPKEILRLGFYFEKESVFLTLGNKIEFDQSFYIEIERVKNGQSQKEILIAYDSSPDQGIYTSEEEMKRSDAKYRRLKAIFYLGDSFYNDLKIFKEQFSHDKIDIKSISFATFRNKKFFVDFEKMETGPKIYPGLNYFSDNWIAFYRQFINLSAKSVLHQFKKENLKEPLSIIDIVTKENKKIEVLLYKKYGSLSGYFVMTSTESGLLELDQDTARYLLLNIQDFWDKKISLPLNKYRLEFQNSKKSISFEVTDKDLFTAKSSQGNANVEEIKKFIDFIKTQANHVSVVEKSDQELVSKYKMKFKIDSKAYKLIYEDSVLIFLDEMKNIMYHYYVGSELPIETELSKFLK